MAASMGPFLSSGKLVAELSQLLLGLEHQAVGLIQHLHALLGFLVGIRIGGGLVLHSLDFLIAQSAGGFDADALLFACGLSVALTLMMPLASMSKETSI